MLTLIQDFQNRSGVVGADRARLLILVTAHAAATALPCFTGEKSDADAYYRQHVQAQMSKLLSAVNERCVFDINTAAKLGRDLWIGRYTLLNGSLEYTDVFTELKKSVDGSNAGQPDLTYAFEVWSENFSREFSKMISGSLGIEG